MLTDKQRADRKLGIGGSDVAAICGLSKWKTPYGVYLDKVAEFEQCDENEFMYFGNVLEPVIADEYEKRTGNKLTVLYNAVIHPKYNWMRANIDRMIVEKNAVLECKTASTYTLSAWGESYTDDFPDEYLLQCAHYAIVLDAAFVDLAVLIGGNQFRIYTYKRNKILEDKIIEKEKEFWHQHVLPKIPPAPTTSEEANTIWKETKSEYLTANDELKEKIKFINNLKKQITDLNKKKEDEELFIKKSLRENEFLTDEFGNNLITWKTQSINRFDIKKLQSAHPDIYKKFLKQSTTRYFKIRGCE